jgi:hypothetical protein
MPANVRCHLRHALPIVCGLTALTLLTSQGAVAQTIPSYATNAHCQRVAGFGGTFSQSVYGSCLNMEQSAALAGPQSRRPCASVATASPALAGRPPTRSCRTAWMWSWLRQRLLGPPRQAAL